MKRLLQSENAIRNYYRLLFNLFMVLIIAMLLGFYVYLWYPFFYAKVSNGTVAHASVTQIHDDGMAVTVVSEDGVVTEGFLESSAKENVAIRDKVWVAYSSDSKFTVLRTPGTWKAFMVSSAILFAFGVFWIGVSIALKRVSDKGISKLLDLVSKWDS